jgi:hypothetical protein
MQVEGACLAETIKLIEYVESKDGVLIHTVRILQHNVNLILFQIGNKFKVFFGVEQSIIAQDVTNGKKKDI